MAQAKAAELGLEDSDLFTTALLQPKPEESHAIPAAAPP